MFRSTLRDGLGHTESRDMQRHSPGHALVSLKDIFGHSKSMLWVKGYVKADTKMSLLKMVCD